MLMLTQVSFSITMEWRSSNTTLLCSLSQELLDAWLTLFGLEHLDYQLKDQDQLHLDGLKRNSVKTKVLNDADL